MKKTTKYIIITLVVLIVLGAAAAALILTSPKDGEDDANSSGTVSESTEPALIDKTAEDVKNIGIEDLAADDSYTIIPTETTTSSGDTEQTFTIEGWDDLDVLYSNVKSLADRLYSITPTKKLGAVEDLSEYGLGSGEGDRTGRGQGGFCPGKAAFQEQGHVFGIQERVQEGGCG